MGCCESTELFAGYELVDQLQLAGIDERFCLPERCTLHLIEKAFTFSGDNFTIRDTNTGIEYFRIEGKAFSFTDKKILYDMYGKPVVNMQEELFTFLTKTQYVYEGDSSKNQLLFEIKTEYSFGQLDMNECIVQDRNTKEKFAFYFIGNWRARNVVITVDRPGHSNIPVAKVEGYRGMFSDEYYVTIVAGVDIALIVMLCVALDEAISD